MSLPEFTLHDFNKIASGEYNAGQIDFATGDNGRSRSRRSTTTSTRGA